MFRDRGVLSYGSELHDANQGITVFSKVRMEAPWYLISPVMGLGPGSSPVCAVVLTAHRTHRSGIAGNTEYAQGSTILVYPAHSKSIVLPVKIGIILCCHQLGVLVELLLRACRFCGPISLRSDIDLMRK
jgi:hypothetical protein